MPLAKGSSDRSVALNIKRGLSEGKPRAQAIAIALAVARRAKAATKKKRGKRKIRGAH
jgi:hypothetical protein